MGSSQTPYRKVLRELSKDSANLVGRELREAIVDGETVLAEAGSVITPELAIRIAAGSQAVIRVRPFVSEIVEYLSADQEDQFVVAQANVVLDSNNQFLEEHVEVRYRQDFLVEMPEHVDYVDVSPKQIVSVATSLIPFLEHDDANRALMGSNMQRRPFPSFVPRYHSSVREWRNRLPTIQVRYNRVERRRC